MAARCPNDLILYRKRPAMGWLLSRRLYFEDEFVCHAIFTEHATNSTSRSTRNKLSLLSSSLGDDDLETLGAADCGNFGLALPCNFRALQSGLCTGSW